MKKQILTLVTLIAILISNMPVSSAGVAPLLMVDIPFNFVAGNQKMPAGRYKITETSTRGVLEIFSYEKEINVMVNFRTESTNQPVEETSLEFRRYGDQYFLGGIVIGGRSTTISIPESSTELMVADDAKYLAGRSGRPQIVKVKSR